MKFTAFIVSFFIFSLLASPVSAGIINNINVSSQGGESRVNVRVNNISNSSVSSYTQSTSRTKINIEQSGEGTSEVKVNGKEWKLEGPGEISVDETSTPNPTPPTSTPTPTEEPTPSPEAITTPSPTPDVLGDDDENQADNISEFVN